MASARTINAPGIELREIDRSNYRKQDSSLPNAPVVLVTGLATKGENYYPQWINSRTTFIEKFGQPSTEFEKCFYYGCMEVINRGGVCIACKLPYNNAESNCDGNGNAQFSCCEYEVKELKNIGDGIEVDKTLNDLQQIRDNLFVVLRYLGCYDEFSAKYDFNKLSDLRSAIDELHNREVEDADMSQIIKQMKEKLADILDEFDANKLSEILLLDSNIRKYI